MDDFIEAIEDRSELVEIFAIPLLLFVLDFALRMCFGMDVTEAGADMSFLAVAVAATIMLDDRHRVVGVMLFLVLLVVWVVCLRVTCAQVSAPVGTLANFFGNLGNLARIVAASCFGILSVLGAGLIAEAISD